MLEQNTLPMIIWIKIMIKKLLLRLISSSLHHNENHSSFYSDSRSSFHCPRTLVTHNPLWVIDRDEYPIRNGLELAKWDKHGHFASRMWIQAGRWSACASAPPFGLCSSSSRSSAAGHRLVIDSPETHPLCDTKQIIVMWYAWNKNPKTGKQNKCQIYKPLKHIFPELETPECVKRWKKKLFIVLLTDEIVGLSQIIIPHTHLQRFTCQLVKCNLVKKLLREIKLDERLDSGDIANNTYSVVLHPKPFKYKFSQIKIYF